MRAPATWLDHYYKMRAPDGKVIYASEPYSVSEDSIRHLARLADKGWDITITAWEATWYPAHTLCIAIRPPDGSTRSLAADIADAYEGTLRPFMKSGGGTRNGNNPADPW
jgi:hypothetical protein